MKYFLVLTSSRYVSDKRARVSTAHWLPPFSPPLSPPLSLSPSLSLLLSMKDHELTTPSQSPMEEELGEAVGGQYEQEEENYDECYYEEEGYGEVENGYEEGYEDQYYEGEGAEEATYVEGFEQAEGGAGWEQEEEEQEQQAVQEGEGEELNGELLDNQEEQADLQQQYLEGHDVTDGWGVGIKGHTAATANGVAAAGDVMQATSEAQVVSHVTLFQNVSTKRLSDTSLNF